MSEKKNKVELNLIPGRDYIPGTPETQSFLNESVIEDLEAEVLDLITDHERWEKEIEIKKADIDKMKLQLSQNRHRQYALKRKVERIYSLFNVAN